MSASQEGPRLLARSVRRTCRSENCTGNTFWSLESKLGRAACHICIACPRRRHNPEYNVACTWSSLPSHYKKQTLHEALCSNAGGSLRGLDNRPAGHSTEGSQSCPVSRT